MPLILMSIPSDVGARRIYVYFNWVFTRCGYGEEPPSVEVYWASVSFSPHLSCEILTLFGPDNHLFFRYRVHRVQVNVGSQLFPRGVYWLVVCHVCQGLVGPIFASSHPEGPPSYYEGFATLSQTVGRAHRDTCVQRYQIPFGPDSPLRHGNAISHSCPKCDQPILCYIPDVSK